MEANGNLPHPGQLDAFSELETGADALTIKMFGVGGAGNNILDRLRFDSLEHVTTVAIDTDQHALNTLGLRKKTLIGGQVTRGLGTGGDVDLGRQSAEADSNRLRELVVGSRLIIIICGLGGGTGSGVAPLLAAIAEEAGALVFAYGILPFSFESVSRKAQASAGLEQLRAQCHAAIALSNDVLMQQLETQSSVIEAFTVADGWIYRGVRSIWSLLFQKSLINVDFSNLKKVFDRRGGKTLFGMGLGTGGNCAANALENLLQCPMLDASDDGIRADNLIVNFTGGMDLCLDEINRLMAEINERFGSGENSVMSVVIDEKMDNKLQICLLGTTPVDGATSIQPASTAIDERSTDSPVEPVNVAEASDPQLIPLVTEVCERVLNVQQRQGELALGLSNIQRGDFDKTECNLYDGVDLDVPTYLRQGIKIIL